MILDARQVGRAMHLFIKGLERAVTPRTRIATDQGIVFAVSNCHPTRVALYAAAFARGWKIEFRQSLREVMDAIRLQRPKAVFFEQTANGAAWDRYCSLLTGQGIPFVLMGYRATDETFLALLAAGGYYACSRLLKSEELVRAVDLAQEVASLHQIIT